MYSNFCLSIKRLSIGLALLLIHQGAVANGAELEIIPGQCVSLHQGQMCYIDIIANWQTSSAGHFCLHTSQTPKAVRCWQHSKAGSHTFKVVGKQDIVFTLQQMPDKVDVARAELEMAWVHKKERNSHSSWRVF